MVKTYRKKTFRRRRRLVRLKRAPRAPNNPNGIHKFTRWTTSSSINTNSGFAYSLTDNTTESLDFSTFTTYTLGTTGTAGSTSYASVNVSFCLADLPDYTELTSLFDQYRISKIKFFVYPVHATGLSAASAGGTIYAGADGYVTCMAHSVTDYDDSSIPAASIAGVLDLMQYPNYKMKGIGQADRPIVRRTFRPRIQQVIETTSGTTTGRALGAKNLFVDMSTPLVQHHGVRFILECHSGATATNYAIQFRIIAQYTIECKNVR